MSWKTQAMLTRTTTRNSDGHYLMILLYETNGKWAIFALTASSIEGLDVLNNHAHDFVGFEPGLVMAMLHADDYANAWILGDDDPDDCECSEIVGPP